MAEKFSQARPALIIRVTALAIACSVSLSGCDLINDLNPDASDKAACDELSKLITSLGEPVGLEGATAITFADSVESDVIPLATSNLGTQLKGLAASLRATGEESIFSMVGGASDAVIYSATIASRCIEVSSKN